VGAQSSRLGELTQVDARAGEQGCAGWYPRRSVEPGEEEKRPSRRPLVLLALGAAAGLALATAGLLGTAGDGSGVPEGAVASVNGVAISGDDYARLVAGLEGDLRRATDAAERKRVLDRMIEEELLVQRGLELGLARHDRRVRGDLVSAVIASVSADAEEKEPDTEELRAFYEAERGFFTRPGRLRVEQIALRVSDPSAEPAVLERAKRALERVRAGEPFATVRAELGDDGVLDVPDALLPPAKLREYVGPSATQAALALEVGQTSEPIRSGTGLHLVHLLEREPAATPPFEELVEEVRAEWRRRAGERALRRYLDELRADAEVSLAEEAPR
jgi:parvulin-like peptidyl-prolyl isomerase